MKKRIVYLNDVWIASDEGLLDQLKPWNLKGKGVFETFRSYAGRFFLLEEHLKRLNRGLERFHIEPPFSRNKIFHLLPEILRVNQIKKTARIRISVWKDKNKIQFSIVALPYQLFSQKQYQNGFKALVFPKRLNRSINSSHIKSIDYQLNFKALRFAESRGCQEVIFLNKNNEITEGSRSNVFLIKEGKFLTPALKCGCLKGITRQMVIQLAKQVGIKVYQKSLSLSDVLNCDEAFLTNSLLELMSLTEVNSQLLGQGTMGPITAFLLNKYRKVVKEKGCQL